MDNIVFVPWEFLSTLSLRRATDVIAVMTDAQSISIHALLAESDDNKPTQHAEQEQFLSTLSLRRATSQSSAKSTPAEISIHALLAESDRLWTILYSCPGNFYPRSPCGERRTKWQVLDVQPKISIHALLAESDRYTKMKMQIVTIFLSTLSLRRATPVRDIIQWEGIFLSTLSLRRATCYSLRHSAQSRHFYPRSPCGERLARFGWFAADSSDFYPRSPCGERPRTPTTVETLI